jgi:hypothetical protein
MNTPGTSRSKPKGSLCEPWSPGSPRIPMIPAVTAPRDACNGSHVVVKKSAPVSGPGGFDASRLRRAVILVNRSGFLKPLRVPVVLPQNDDGPLSEVAARVGRKFYGAQFAGLAT